VSQPDGNSGDAGLRILYVATKPAFPPTDGGRLLMWYTIGALAARGHSITFVAPDLGLDHSPIEERLGGCCAGVQLVRAHSRHIGSALLTAVLLHRPLSIIRHSHPAVRTRVAELLAGGAFDVVHAEQVHALANLPPEAQALPVVLRAQNVESELWRMVARTRPRFSWLARNEARKMAAYEARAIARVGTTIALTRDDGAALAGGQGMAGRSVRVVSAPFPSRLPPAECPLEGSPAIVLLAGGWLPNRDSTLWFLAFIWPAIRARNPASKLHVFGGGKSTGEPGVCWHPSPEDSRQLFRRNALLVVPLRVASGIRMKILEAWARGVPVIATPEAARGLGGHDGKEFLLARNGSEFAAAVHRIANEPHLGLELAAGGRSALASRHDPALVASSLESIYRDLTIC
jgi:hypothetical protein